MNAADRRRMTPMLAIVAAVLALLVLALWLGLGRGAHWRDDAASPKLPSTAANVPPPEVPALESYADVWQRPLFSPDRQPEAAAGGDATASGDLELTGVVMLPGLNMAILHDKSANRDYRVVQGRPSRDGLALVDLKPRSAVVESGGSRLNLRLLPGTSPAAGDAASAGAGQGASAIVNGSGADDSGQPAAQPVSVSGDAADARQRQLRERLEAARRRAARQQSSGG